VGPLNRELAEPACATLPPEVTEVIANSIMRAATSDVLGLAIGDRAPDFALLSHTGAVFRVSERLGRGPVVLCFLRGEWCPYCQLELRALQRSAPAIRILGASLVFVHPQPRDASLRMSGGRSDLDVCSDPDQRVLCAYRVRFRVAPEVKQLYLDHLGLDLGRINASGEWNLPVPACFVIDRDGVIKGRQFCHDFRVRVEPGYILDVLDELALAH
jgi:peroxiredoxin